MTLEVRIPKAIMESIAFPKGWEVTLKLETGDTSVQLGEWKRKLKKLTSNKKKLETIFFGLYCNGGILEEQLIIAVRIKSNSYTAV